MSAIELYRCTAAFERHLADLQGGILEVRMVPLGHLFDKLARIVRQISREPTRTSTCHHRRRYRGDKLIVEELSDPLMHIFGTRSITPSRRESSARGSASCRREPLR